MNVWKAIVTRSLALACLAALLLPQSAMAQSTWQGAGSDGTWSTSGNWSSLANGFSTGLVFSGINNLASVNDFASGTATSLAFASGAGAFTISGSAFTLTGNIANNSASLQSIANNLTLLGNSTVTGTSVTLSGVLTNSSGNRMLTNNLSAGSLLTLGAINLSEGNTARILTLAGFGNTTIAGSIVNGGTAASQIIVSNSGSTSLRGASTWTGNTTLQSTAGAVIFSGASGGNAGASVYILQGGRMILDNTGAGNDNIDRIANASALQVGAGAFIFLGSDQAGTNSTETIGAITNNPSNGLGGAITVSFGGTNLATLTGSSFLYTAGYGTTLINGTNLGKNSTDTSSVGKLILTTAPTLVGGTSATTSGINASAKNTQIVPHLLGESGTASGELGTATGAANTFLTYNANAGLRPLNPTDEFANNSIVSGNNTYITAATTASTTGTINSLVINGGSLSIADSGTLTNSSGAVLFASSNAIAPAGATGAISFAREAIISVNTGVTGTISTAITGTSAVTYSGRGTLILSGSNRYTGGTTLSIGTVVIGDNAAFSSGAVTTSATVTLRASTDLNSISNAFTLTSNPTLAGSNSIGLTGTVTNSGANRTLTNNIASGKELTLNAIKLSEGNTGRTLTLAGTGNTTIAGSIINGGTGNSSLAISSTGTTTLSGSNAYSGVTTISGAGTVMLSNNAAFGSGTVSVTGAATLQAATDLNAIQNTFALTNSPTFTGASSIGLTGTLMNSGGNRTVTNNIGNGKLLTFSGTTFLQESGTGVGRTLTLAGSGNTTFVGPVVNGGTSGNSGLTITNTGTTTLLGANTYSGTTTLSAGVINLGAAENSGSSGPLGTNTAAGAIVLSGGTLQYSTNNVTDYSGRFSTAANQRYNVDTNGQNVTWATALTSSTGSLTKLGSGTLTLSASNSYTGATTISAGAVALVGSGAIASTGTVNTAGSGARFDVSGIAASSLTIGALSGFADSIVALGDRSLTVGDSTSTAFAGALGGTGGLTKQGGGTLTLSGANTYSGTTTLNAGVINLGSAEAAGTSGPLGTNTAAGAIVLSGGTLQYSTSNSYDYSSRFSSAVNQKYNVDTNGQNVTWATAMTSGSGSLTKLGSGTLTLTGANTFSGNIVLSGSGGRLVIGGAGQLLGTTGTYGGTITGTNVTIDFQSSASSILSGIISGTTTLLKSGSGTLTLSGANTFTNGVTLCAGQLNINNAKALGSAASTFTISGGTIGNTSVAAITVSNTNAQNWSGDFSFVGSSALNLGTGAVTLGGTNVNVTVTSSTLTVGGAIGDGGNGYALTKSGSGTLALSGNSTFTGPTTVSSGTLQIGAGSTSGAIASSTVSLAAGAVLAFNRTDAYGGAFSSMITGSGGVRLASGTVTLSASNSYLGGTTLSGIGTVILGDNAAFGTGVVTTSTSATLQTASDLNNIGNAFTLSGNPIFAGSNSIGLTGAITNSGAGRTITNNVTGGKVLTLSGTTFLQESGTGVGRILTLAGSGNTTFSGPIINGGTAGNSGLTITNTGMTTLSGANTYSGTTTLSGGIVNLGSVENAGTSGPLGKNTAAGAIVLSGGTLQYSTSNNYDYSSRFSTAAGQKYNVDTNGRNVTWATALTSSGGSVTKLGSGTLALSGSNGFSGAATINAGVISFSDKNAFSQASGIGIAGGAGLTYTGIADTFGKNITVTAGSGTGTITNSGGLLTLSGTLSKDNSVLRLTGGAFNITGLITGATPGRSDLVVDAASVTLSNVNAYDGPTYVYNSGTLAVGITNAIPGNSVVTLGNDGSVGTLVTGTFSIAIGGLAFGSSGGTLKLTPTAAQTSIVQMSAAGAVALGGGPSTLDLTGMANTGGLYKLITGASLTGTFSSVNGLDSNYVLRYGTVNENELDAQRKADQAGTFAMTTGAVTRALVNTKVAISGTVSNSSPTDSTALVLGLSSTGLTGSGFTTASVAAGSSLVVSGMLNSGSTAGTRSWAVTNTDNAAITAISTATGALQVVNQRSFSVSTPTIALGFLHQNGSIGSRTVDVTSTGTHAITASATLGSFSDGPSGFTLSLTSGSAQFNGANESQSTTYTLSGAASALGAISGTFTSAVAGEFTGIPSVNVAVTGNVYSGQSTWAKDGGGNWGTLTGTGENAFGFNWGATQGSPGLDGAFTNTDAATFGSALTSSTATISLVGATPSLRAITFDSGSGSYLISGGGITMASVTGTAALNVLGGAHEIATNMSFASLTSVFTGSSAVLTLSGAIDGSAGIVKTGAGTLNLVAANSYSGNTRIDAGTLKIFNATSFGSGTVTLESGAILDLDNLSITNTLVNLGGTIINSGSYTGRQTVSGTATFSGTTAGTIALNNGGSATFSGPVAASVTLENGASATVSGNVTSSAALVVSASSSLVADQGSSFAAGSRITNAGQFIVSTSGTTPIASVISGAGDLIVSGGGLVQLTGTSSEFTGQTSVSGPGTQLVVNGVLGSSSIEVGAGALLAGSGVISGVLAGEGLVSPGNSPGIMTASQFDPSTGLGAGFEFTTTAPIYTNPTVSLNDVLRLTSSTPFTGALGGGNAIDIYFHVNSVAAGDTFEGGFFTVLSAENLLTMVEDATFHYWILDSHGSEVFNGYQYSPLTSLPGITGAKLTTVARTANFGGSDVNGSVTQFVIIPEPDTIVFAGIGIAMAGWSLWKRRAR